jgi:AcrR family transcriptional regulator
MTPAPSRADTRPSRRRASHSMETVITEAVALLDEAGSSALTFRALATRLGGGVGSIYWYVASKDELLDRAADRVLGFVLADTERFTGSDADPISNIRGISVTHFDAGMQRRWLADYLMRDTGLQPNGLRLYERLGQQVLRLKLTPRQSFHAVSAVTGYVVGTSADLGREPPEDVQQGDVTRDEFLAGYADHWRALDPSDFPFVHEIVDEFAQHDDRDLFLAGLDLLLAGLQLQAKR